MNVGGENFFPSQLGVFVFGKMKETVEAHLWEKRAPAFVTILACYHDAQRQATQDVGKICGLEVLRTTNQL